MTKLKSKAGMTLIEMMAALLIMVLLVVGMGTGMDAGMRVYRDSKFETDSAALADILNTSFGDLFRYAENVTAKTSLSADDQNKLPTGMEFVFTNPEYGILNGYFHLNTDTGAVQLMDLQSGTKKDLVNTGVYPNLEISDLDVLYAPPGVQELPIEGKPEPVKVGRGGLFYVTYQIRSTVDTAKTKDVVTVVRQMNTN